MHPVTIYGPHPTTAGYTTDTLTATDGIIFTNTSGKGIQLGDGSSEAFGWRDITGQIDTRVGGTNPTWTQIGAGPFYAYAFGVNDECWIHYHIPHDIVPSTDIHLHCHWLPSGTDANNVKWEWYYSFAKGFDQAAFNTTGTQITAEQAGPGTAYQHMVTETTGITISGLTEPDGFLMTRMRRVTNGGTENTDTIYVLTADVHYQSTGILTTANKAPDFYTLP